MHIRPKKWGTFQHYKGRTPPWIKLHRALLDNRKFQCLPLASRALAPMLWLLASEDAAGLIRADDEGLKDIAFRLRTTVEDLEEALKPLIDGKHFDVIEVPASKPIANCKQDACLETEGEKEEEKKELSAEADLPDVSFEEFWKVYPTDRNMSRKAAETQWKRLSPDKRAAALAAVPGFKAYCAANSWYRPVHAERFLSQERFEGYAAASNVKAADTGALSSLWDGAAAPLLAEIGAEKFQAWFGGAQFVREPSPRLIFQKPYQRNWVRDHSELSRPLRKHLGDVQLEVSA